MWPKNLFGLHRSVCYDFGIGEGIAAASAASAASAGTATAASTSMLAYAAAAASVISAGISAYGMYSQGQAADEAAKKNAEFQNKTAISAENAAANAAADNQLKTRRLIASQIAAAGAGGVDPSTGTPLEIQGQTAQSGELDNLRIINNAAMSAWGYKTQASIDLEQGGKAATAGAINAAGTLIGGASSAYFGGRKAGLWGTA